MVDPYFRRDCSLCLHSERIEKSSIASRKWMNERVDWRLRSCSRERQDVYEALFSTLGWFMIAPFENREHCDCLFTPDLSGPLSLCSAIGQRSASLDEWFKSLNETFRNDKKKRCAQDGTWASCLPLPLSQITVWSRRVIIAFLKVTAFAAASNQLDSFTISFPSPSAPTLASSNSKLQSNSLLFAVAVMTFTIIFVSF